MSVRRSSYAGWFLAAIALHAAVIFASSKVIDLRPEYDVAVGESIEMTLVESLGVPAVEEPNVEVAPVPPPEPPREPDPLPPPPPPPEPIAEPLPPPPEPEMIEPPRDSPPPPVPKVASTPRPSRRATAPAKSARLPAQTAGGAPGRRDLSGVRTNAKPSYLRNPPPAYPFASKQAHEEGVVVLTVAVTEDGRAASVRLHRSSGFPRLDEAALRAVERWRFSPARIGGIAVSSEVQVPVRFQLK